MKKILVFVFVSLVLLASPSFAADGEIVVESTRISIPAPEGFVNVTHAWPEVMAHFESMSSQNMRYQAVLLPIEDVQNEETFLIRYLTVQTSRQFEPIDFTPDMFAELRQEFRAQMRGIFDEVIGEVNENLPQTAKDLDVKIGETLHIPFESESENHIGFSMLTNVSSGPDNEIIIANSYAMVLAKNRLIYAYVYSRYDTANDLAWTQNTLEEWVAAILESNGKP